MLHPPSVPSPFVRGLTNTLSYMKAPFGTRWLKPIDFDTAERREQGLVIVLPGIEGAGVLNFSLIRGLVDSGLPCAIRLHDWTIKAKPGLMNLWFTRRVQRAAARVVEQVHDYQREFPNQPVSLIGHSGGGALIAYILQELPPQNKIHTAVMVAPALSPRFDLSYALERVNTRLVNIRSCYDWYFLGVGTTLVGTMDRRFGRAAGNVGFKLPSPDQVERHQRYTKKFLEICFRPQMLRDWHYGGHFSCMNRVFVERNIAPLLGNATVPEMVDNLAGLPLAEGLLEATQQATAAAMSERPCSAMTVEV